METPNSDGCPSPDMRVSVVCCTHTLARYDDCRGAAESVLGQSHDDVELVLVSDGNDAVAERFEADFGDRSDVLIHCNDENIGLLESRNNGARIATGDVVAFIDDDAVAADDWATKLVAAYDADESRQAVGGRMVPAWVAGKPSYLPAEFYWLIGVTNRGFGPNGDPDEAGEVRNTFGSNISFRRDVFLELGGFEDDIGGRQGEKNLQGGETELCARLRSEYGVGVYYVPDALVHTKYSTTGPTRGGSSTGRSGRGIRNAGWNCSFPSPPAKNPISWGDSLLRSSPNASARWFAHPRSPVSSSFCSCSS